MRSSALPKTGTLRLGAAFALFFYAALTSAADAPLPAARIPAAATLSVDRDKAGAWLAALIKSKEERAAKEITVLRRQLRDEHDAELSTERDRRRRQDRYEAAFGSMPSRTAAESTSVLRVKLEFQVPEVDLFRRAAAALDARAALCRDILALLSHLPTDADGCLSGDAYKSAGALLNATAKLQHALDGNDDGWVTAQDLDAERDLPSSAADALVAGRASAHVPGFFIQPFDRRQRGKLDLDERKALALEFLNLSLRAEQDSACYTWAADELAALRRTAAAKFANVDIDTADKAGEK